MKTVYLLIGIMVLAFAAGLQAKPRDWTNSSGATIHAEYRGMEGDKVLLFANGTQYRVTLSTLSAEDQAFVAEALKAMPEDEVSAEEEGFERPPEGWRRPDLLDDLDGELVLLEDGRIKDHEILNEHKLEYVAFYNSASWCPPCQAFSPGLIRAYESMKEEKDNFELILVSVDNSKGDWEDYMEQHEMSFPSLDFRARSRVVDAANEGKNANFVPSIHIVRLSDGEVVFDGEDGATSGLRRLQQLVRGEE